MIGSYFPLIWGSQSKPMRMAPFCLLFGGKRHVCRSLQQIAWIRFCSWFISYAWKFELRLLDGFPVKFEYG